MATKKQQQPSFAQAVADLALAEGNAKAVNADAKQAREVKQSAATEVVFAAHRDKHDPSTIYSDLVAVGVAKGTASKIATVVSALADGSIDVVDVRSLSQAYNAVRAVLAAKLAASVGATVPTSPTPVPATATTPDEALKIILDAISGAGDDDAVMKAAGDWIEKITNAITDLMRGSEEDEED